MEYYTREAGEPHIDKWGIRTFIYKFQGAFKGTDRVSIFDRHNGSMHPDMIYVLQRLSDATGRDILTMDEYNEISQEYNQTNGIWKKGIRAEEILPRYLRQLDDLTIADETLRELDALSKAGKTDGIWDYANMRAEKREAARKVFYSREYVDQWLKCMEEIRESLDDESRWNASISIFEID